MTNTSGEALFDVTDTDEEILIGRWSTQLEVIYTFVDASQCTTNCSLTHLIPIVDAPI